MLKAIFIGNLGTDAEERFTAKGTRLIQFSVAVNGRRPGVDGEWIDHTDWFRVKVSGRQVDYCAMLNKGNRVQVIGNLQVNAYMSKDNEPRAGLDVFADEVTNLTPRDGAPQEDSHWEEPTTAATGQNSRPAGRQQTSASTEDLEDLPF